MKFTWLSATTAAILAVGSATVLGAAPAAAAIAEHSNGAGVCISQVAIQPSQVGLARLGDGLKAMASPGTPGSGVPTNLDGARNACGEPPGPGHL